MTKKLILVIFGLFLSLIILEAGLRLAGFVILSLQEHKNRIAISKKNTYRIMCLGESTTQNQYPLFLEQVLNQRNTGIKFSVIDKGMAAVDTSIILAQLETNLSAYNPDMVVAMTGINDRGPHMVYKTDPTSFFGHFRVYNLLRLVWLSFSKPRSTAIRVKGEKFSLEKNQLEQIIRSGPQDSRAYIKIGVYYRDILRKFPQAEEAFKKAIELSPKNYRAHIELGSLYRKQGNFLQAEEVLRKAIELNPNDDWAYAESGRFYCDEGNFLQAEEAFKKAIELKSNDTSVYFELGIVYLYFLRKFPQAEEIFKKAIELNPQGDLAYIGLGRLYREQHKFTQAEEAFKKAVELNPQNYNIYVELGWLYHDQGRTLEAEGAFMKTVDVVPQNDRLCAIISVVCGELGRSQLANKYARKADSLRIGYYNFDTVDNYYRLKSILDKRGIKFVCVQYPMRSIEPLKKMFRGNEEGIIFVDNEQSFKDAVGKTNYKEYFTDSFGGDFGHCTNKGNRLLAENIANAILKEAFNK